MRNRGMTLVEVMVATVIVVPALVGIMQLIPNLLTADRKAEDVTRTTYLAEKKIEEIKRGTKTLDGWISYTTVEAFPAPDSQYKYSVIDNMPAGLIKELKIEVWRDLNNNSIPDSNEYSVVFDTKAAKTD